MPENDEAQHEPVASARQRDIAGMRFGRLVAIEPTDKRISGSVVWRCKCDCGRECEVASTELRRGRVRSCGCLRGRDASEYEAISLGDRFGRLVVVEEAGRRRDGASTSWLCRCDCGSEVVVGALDLLERGKRDCGCLWRGSASGSGSGSESGSDAESGPGASSESVSGSGKEFGPGQGSGAESGSGSSSGSGSNPSSGSSGSFVDLAGQRFGRLVAVRPVGSSPRGAYELWVCRCDCGNEKTVRSTDLKRGNVKSCGCLRASGGGHALELEGRRFGRLEVIGRAPGRGGRAMWLCRCDCGNECTASSYALAHGVKRSCGCLKRERVAARDITGRRFGKLVAVRPAGKLKGGHPLWICRCDCGRGAQASIRELELGSARSCGMCNARKGSLP